MKTKINSAMFSKINWTSALQGIVGLLLLWELLPEDLNDKVAGTALIVGGGLNMVFRTWFTTNVTEEDRDDVA